MSGAMPPPGSEGQIQSAAPRYGRILFPAKSARFRGAGYLISRYSAIAGAPVFVGLPYSAAVSSAGSERQERSAVSAKGGFLFFSATLALFRSAGYLMSRDLAIGEVPVFVGPLFPGAVSAAGSEGLLRSAVPPTGGGIGRECQFSCPFNLPALLLITFRRS